MSRSWPPASSGCCEGKQTPVDIRQEQADRIDNQIDTLGKAFLGQTIACARCHDHKFDAITTRDYYALAGYLRSSRYQQAFIDPPERFAGASRRAGRHCRRRSREQAKADPRVVVGQAVVASQPLSCSPLMQPARAWPARRTPTRRCSAAAATSSSVDARRLERWVEGTGRRLVATTEHPLTPGAVHEVASERAGAAGAIADEAGKRLERRPAAVSVRRFSRPRLRRLVRHRRTPFVRSGRAGEIVVGESRRAARRPVHDRRAPTAALLAAACRASCVRRRSRSTSRSCTSASPGSNARVNLVIDGNTLIMNPMYGKLTTAARRQSCPCGGRCRVDRWLGHRAYIEISDCTIPMHRLNPPPSAARVPAGKGDGYIAVEQIVFSDQPRAAGRSPRRTPACADHEPAGVWRHWRLRISSKCCESLARWSRPDRSRRRRLTLLNWLLETGLLDETQSAIRELAEMLKQLSRAGSSAARAAASTGARRRHGRG